MASQLGTVRAEGALGFFFALCPAFDPDVPPGDPRGLLTHVEIAELDGRLRTPLSVSDVRAD